MIRVSDVDSDPKSTCDLDGTQRPRYSAMDTVLGGWSVEETRPIRQSNVVVLDLLVGEDQVVYLLILDLMSLMMQALAPVRS